jgi:hypothetical protein
MGDPNGANVFTLRGMFFVIILLFPFGHDMRTMLLSLIDLIIDATRLLAAC